LERACGRARNRNRDWDDRNRLRERVLHCIARLSGVGQVPASLSLSFGLSAWMKRFGLGLDETVSTILNLRTALLTVSGLDTASEPVPLRVADRVMFVLNLAVYLDGLLAARLGPSGSRQEKPPMPLWSCCARTDDRRRPRSIVGS